MSFCIRDRDCVVYDAVQKLAGYSGSEVLCFACQDAAAGVLHALLYDYVDLTQLLPKADVRNDGKIFRPKPESSPPISLEAWWLRADIAFFVGVVTKVLRGHLGIPAPYRRMPVREGFGMQEDTTWLARHVRDLAKMPARPAVYFDAADGQPEQPAELSGLDIIEHLGMLHRKARRTCGTAPAVVSVPGWCPACTAVALKRHDDDTSKLWCAACRHKLSDVDYAQMARLKMDVP